MQLDFFNTIHLSGADLVDARESCNKQESRIIDLIQAGREYTPFEVQDLYNAIYPPCPVTSIRRAMTCLTAKGFLAKSENFKKGIYGKVNHTWRKC